MIPNLVSAIRSILRSDGPTAALVPGPPATSGIDLAIYAGGMPLDEAKLQPRAAVVISWAGGYPVRGHVPLGRPRFDVKAYGVNGLAAMTLSNAVHDALKNVDRRRVVAGLAQPTIVYGVDEEGGPTELRDADGDWPFILRTYIALYAERAA
jgi:hypothetical protein